MSDTKSSVTRLKEEISKRFVGNEDSVDIIVNNLLHTRSTALIRAARGTGKSTLMMLLLKGIFGDDHVVISGASEVKRGEVIGRLHIPSLEREGTERVLWAKFVETLGKGIDEVNRLNPYTTANVHHLMQFGEVWAYGQRQNVADFTLVANENPGDTTTFLQPPPFYDRFDICVYLNSLTLSQKFELQEKERQSSGMLVESMPQVLDPEILRNIRGEVAEIELDSDLQGFINVLVRDFQSCVRDKEHSEISPPALCDGCHFTRFVCSIVKEPPSERATLVLSQLARARIFLRGSVSREDILEMAKWALVHRTILVRLKNPLEDFRELMERESERMHERDSRGQWLILNELFSGFKPGLYKTAKEIGVEDNVFAEELFRLEAQWVREGKLRREETLMATSSSR